MASLAPGNGWFPHQPNDRKGHYARSTRIHAVQLDNVYEFPPVAARRTAIGSGTGILAKMVDLLVVESLKAGRTAIWMLICGMLAAVLAVLVWLGFMGAIVGASVALGVSWTTAAAAVTATHVLAAILLIVLGVRLGRALLTSAGKRTHAGENELL